jgi:hypothetical protein
MVLDFKNPTRIFVLMNSFDNMTIRERQKQSLKVAWALIMVGLALSMIGVVYYDRADTTTLGIALMSLGIVMVVILGGGLIFGVVRNS